MYLGAHVSIAGSVTNAVDRELEIGGTCGQIFTHAPQRWKHTAITDEEADRFRTNTAAELGGPWVIHASYLVNLSTPKSELRAKSLRSMQQELDTAARLGIPYVNVHLGAHTGAGVEAGLSNAASALDELDVPEGITVLIESDAGGGTKLGAQFGHLAEILHRTDQNLGICIDTAHLFVAGYDLSTPAAVDETVATFDDVVGLDALCCIHLNDSKHPCGSHRDEHAHIGEGHIGPVGMQRVVNHPALRDRPYVLETPKEDEKSDPWNIARVREMRRER